MQDYQHIHLKECSSTQKELQSILSKSLKSQVSMKTDRNILVSTSQQNSGHGRSGRIWRFFEQSLAFSFSFEPGLEQVQLLSLEMGLILSNFFESTYSKKFFLKWPNDLYDKKGKKLGGILLNIIDKKKIIAGIGLNLFISDLEKRNFFHDFKDSLYKPAGLYSKPLPTIENLKRDIPLSFVNYFQENRIEEKKIISEWIKKCCHLHKVVLVKNSTTSFKGEFIGLEDNGMALIKNLSTKKLHTIINGDLSLRITDCLE